MTSAPQPRVGVIMGSDSDWSVMEDAAQALAEFDVPFEVGVVSAHRTPARMLDYAGSAAGRGIEVIIAGGHVYLHIPFSAYQELTGSQAAEVPDMAKLFDPTKGLPAVIPEGRNLKYIGADKVDGVDVQKIGATYSADQVRAMLAQLSSSVDVNAELWVGSSDHLIRKAVLAGAFGDGGTEAAVEVDISKFNAAVNITPPTP